VINAQIDNNILIGALKSQGTQTGIEEVRNFEGETRIGTRLFGVRMRDGRVAFLHETLGIGAAALPRDPE
jgi:hypothetical protein